MASPVFGCQMARGLNPCKEELTIKPGGRHAARCQWEMIAIVTKQIGAAASVRKLENWIRRRGESDCNQSH